MNITEKDLLPFLIFVLCFLYNIIYLAIFSQKFRKGISIFVCVVTLLAIINWLSQGLFVKRWDDIGFLVSVLIFVLISGAIAMAVTGVMAVKAARQQWQHEFENFSALLLCIYRLSPIVIHIVIILQFLKLIPKMI